MQPVCLTHLQWEHSGEDTHFHQPLLKLACTVCHSEWISAAEAPSIVATAHCKVGCSFRVTWSDLSRTFCGKPPNFLFLTNKRLKTEPNMPYVPDIQC